MGRLWRRSYKSKVSATEEKKLKAVLQTRQKMKKKGGALFGLPALMELWMDVTLQK